METTETKIDVLTNIKFTILSYISLDNKAPFYSGVDLKAEIPPLLDEHLHIVITALRYATADGSPNYDRLFEDVEHVIRIIENLEKCEIEETIIDIDYLIKRCMIIIGILHTYMIKI